MDYINSQTYKVNYYDILNMPLLVGIGLRTILRGEGYKLVSGKDKVKAIESW